MTGLQIELEKNKRRAKSKRNKMLNITGISKILGVSYPTAKRKLDTNYFLVDEALSILSLLFNNYTLEQLEYLFTEQKNEKLYFNPNQD